MKRTRVGRIARWIGLVVALPCLVAMVVYVRGIVSSRSLAARSREAVASNRGAEARALLDQWAALGPQGGEPEYYRAMLDVRADRPAEALDAMRKALAQGYPKEPLMVLRAVLLARAGRPGEAEPLLATAFRNATEPRVEIAEGLSRIYLDSFRLLEADRVLEAWIKAAPEDPRPYLRRIDVDERTNAEPPTRVRNYREALRRDPSLIEARLGLAETLREGSLVDEAEVEYATLLKLDPKNIKGLVGAGRIALLKGDLPTATHDYEAALALDPREKVALRELGMLDLNSGRITQACARLKMAAEVDPFDPEIHYTYSRALKLAGQDALAAEEVAATERLKQEKQKVLDLQQSLVQRPDDYEIRCEVAKWLIEHGHEKEGLDWTKLILQKRPGHPATCQLLVDYHTRRGDHGLANYYRIAASPADPGK